MFHAVWKAIPQVQGPSLADWLVHWIGHHVLEIKMLSHVLVDVKILPVYQNFLKSNSITAQLYRLIDYLDQVKR